MPAQLRGIHIIQILNILEGFDLTAAGHNSAETIHLMAESMKRAYADRSEFLGDPDFVQVPQKGLTAKTYATERRKEINRQKASDSSKIKPGQAPAFESDQTTHFSVVDREGNAVANTYTINWTYGSGIVVEGAGFLLNNEMDDFSIEKGISPDTIKLLTEMGHTVSLKAAMGAAQSILVDPATGMRYGAADPRREGLALGH